MNWKRGTLALAGAWLLPLATHAVGADLLLPPAILLALMAVQRGATSVLDRFVLALGQLVGATCAAGLVISVWPWRMAQVAVAGVAFSVLAVLAFLRRPVLPRRGDARDALVVACWLGATALAAVPLAARDLGGRLGIVAPGEDLARHFVIFDAIGQLGGYAFLHVDQAQRFVPDGPGVGILTYPQGTHFLYALLGRFWVIGSDGVAAMSWLIWCVLATYSFLVLAVLWAIRRVAGPGRSATALLVVVLPVGAYLFFGDPLAVLFRGFPNELLGLALAALLVAVLARPLNRTGEQIATVVALVVGISFTYYLFLPFAGLAAAGWALWRWRELRRRPVLVALAVLAAPVTLVTPLANPQANTGNQLLLKGTALTVDRPAALAVVALAIAGLVLAGGPRSPVRRAVAVALGMALGTVGVLAVYQYATVGHTVYYFEKAVHLLLVVSLVATGALVRLVPARASGSVGAHRLGSGRFGSVLAVSLVVCAVVVALGGPSHTQVGSYGLRMVLGIEKGTPQGGRDALLMARTYPDPNGPVVVDLMHTPYANFFGTLYGSAMRRDYRHGESWYGFLWPAGPPKTVADIERMVEASPKPIRLLVSDPAARSLAGAGGLSNVEIARDLAAKYPGKVLIARPNVRS
jgi:hypothetical protein